MEIALITCAALPGLPRDDRVLLHALRDSGVDAHPVVWEDAHQDWRQPRLCLIRAAWDYAFRRDAFVNWAKSVATETNLWNSVGIVEWNTHKRYLLDLATYFPGALLDFVAESPQLLESLWKPLRDATRRPTPRRPHPTAGQCRLRPAGRRCSPTQRRRPRSPRTRSGCPGRNRPRP